MRAVQEAARSLGLQVHVLRARTEQEIDAAFATLVRLRAGALVVATESVVRLTGVSISSGWRHATPCLRSLTYASSSPPAA